MKRLLISIAVAGLLLSGCCGHCPKQDVYIVTHGPLGMMILHMEKGTLDEEYKDKEWIPAPKRPEQVMKAEP